jgi:proline dehydrogenase
MRILGRQFVLGRTIDEALKEARGLIKQGYRFSFDMLGEAAYTRTTRRAIYDVLPQCARGDRARQPDLESRRCSSGPASR